MKILQAVLLVQALYWFLLASTFSQRGEREARLVCIVIGWVLVANSLLVLTYRKHTHRAREPLIRSMSKSVEQSACLIGTPKQCIQKIEQYEKAGAQQIVAGFYDFPSLKGLKIFAKSVIPHFK